MAKRAILGLTEEVTLLGKDGGKEKVLVRIDTGATCSSIDEIMAQRLGLGPIVRTKLVKSASGRKVRDIVIGQVQIKGKLIEGDFTIANREGMTYPALIGQNVLKKGNFLVDPMID